MTKQDTKLGTDRAEFISFDLARQWAHDNVNGFPSWLVEQVGSFAFVVALIPNDLYLSNEDVGDKFGDPFNAGTRSDPEAEALRRESKAAPGPLDT